MIKKISANNLLFSFIILTVFAFLVPSVKFFNNSTSNYFKKVQKHGNSKYPSVFPITDDDKKWIENTLEKMTTKEKCAQMVFPWVPGKDYSDDTAGYARMEHFVKDLKVGGIVFSFGSAFDEAKDINEIQKISEIPLLISSDFETGTGMRISDGTDFPYNMAVAATGIPKFAFQMGEIVAKESKAIGVNQNYAPVVDVNNNPDNPVIGIRSYSEDKNIVAKYADEFIKGLQSQKMIATAKHFPGHGNTKTDSHIDLPIIREDSTDILKNEMVPFIRAIDSGVQSVMVGHLAVPSIESNKSLPATLSKNIVTNLLKKKLGFDGLVVTDAMNMQAILKYYSVAEAAEMAVEAGNDILIMPADVEVTINAIVDAVQSGKIDIQRINESVRKILAAKMWLKLQNNKTVNIKHVKDVVNNDSSKFLSQKIADKSITLIRNTRRVIPILPSKYKNVISIVFSYEIGQDSVLTFQKLVENNFKRSLLFILNKNSRTQDFERVLHYVKKADLILVPYLMRPPSDKESHKVFEKFKKVINKLLVTRAPVVLLSFGDPYLLSRYKTTKTYLSAFSDVPTSQRAMMKALLGEINITGELPVSLPGTNYKIGFGIKMKALNDEYFRKRN